IRIFGAHGALHAHLGVGLVRRLMGDHALGERQHQLAATGDSLPDLGLGLLLCPRLLVLTGAEDLVFIATLIATPTYFDLDPFGITVHAEGHAEAARHQRLVAGRVDLV